MKKQTVMCGKTTQYTLFTKGKLYYVYRQSSDGILPNQIVRHGTYKDCLEYINEKLIEYQTL